MQIPGDVLEFIVDATLYVLEQKTFDNSGLDKEKWVMLRPDLKNHVIDYIYKQSATGSPGNEPYPEKTLNIQEIERRTSAGVSPSVTAKPKYDSTLIIPVIFDDKTLGTISINKDHPDHKLLLEKKNILEGVLNQFFEFILQAKTPECQHDPPSQLYMMNIFREYNTIRELRILFDYIFFLITHILKIPKKGVFILNHPEKDFFELVVGYGFESSQYKEIYEQLVPKLRDNRIDTVRDITILNRKDFLQEDTFLEKEDYFILIPLVRKEKVLGMILIFESECPGLDETALLSIKPVCDIATTVIEKSISGRWLHDLTFTDSLTGTYNYGLWWRRLHEEIQRSKREKNSGISLIIFDIDHFNRFNRDHGYFLGDQLLRVIADKIKGCIRNIDIVGRIGGEEFGVILVGAPQENTLMVANRILESVFAIASEMKLDISTPVTMSAGCTIFPIDAEDPVTLVEKAKTALMSAKIMGGNRIVMYQSIED